MTKIRYASVCSGIEAPSVAWGNLGWEAAWFCENAKSPSIVLNHHYPGVPNLGDLTQIHEKPEIDQPIDLIFGGTPCQSFSVAGLRRGLDDPRGNLALKFMQLADRARPRWVVWENVPGVLSSDGGRAFGSILGALAELRYGWAYRILDAQHFGVPQRRRRVFLVGHSGGSWQRAAAVLFDAPGLQGDIEARKKERKGVATAPASGASAGGGFSTDFDLDGRQITGSRQISPTVTSKWSKGTGVPAGDEVQNLVWCMDTSHVTSPENGAIPSLEISSTLQAEATPPMIFGWQNSASRGDSVGAISPALDASKTPAVSHGDVVRRLTPLECERLMGLPDNYTLVPVNKKGGLMKDGPRYQMIGNSIAVPVLRWIGERIDAVDAL